MQKIDNGEREGETLDDGGDSVGGRGWSVVSDAWVGVRVRFRPPLKVLSSTLFSHTPAQAQAQAQAQTTSITPLGSCEGNNDRLANWRLSGRVLLSESVG